jgi:murein DD-endopeptidase MepM/ murein hydrolase activator NlpD
MSDRRSVSILVVPDNGRETWTLRLSYQRLRIISGLVVVAVVLLGIMAGSWWYFAARASKAAQLEARVAELELERTRIGVLANELEQLEAEYGRLRDLFGAGSPDASGPLWLPPSTGASRATPRELESDTPASWPLTERGFVTQGLFEGEGPDHPGVDIAVPTGSYIRAAGSGVVVEAGSDPVYGMFVTIDHTGGYRTVYGHASRLMVSPGDTVRRNEIIALTGSTGRSTAPHLHFEVLLDGLPVDPFTVVQRP